MCSVQLVQLPGKNRKGWTLEIMNIYHCTIWCLLYSKITSLLFAFFPAIISYGGNVAFSIKCNASQLLTRGCASFCLWSKPMHMYLRESPSGPSRMSFCDMLTQEVQQGWETSESEHLPGLVPPQFTVPISRLGLWTVLLCASLECFCLAGMCPLKENWNPAVIFCYLLCLVYFIQCILLALIQG